MSPPSYPRIPHLVPGRGTDDDRVLQPADAGLLLSNPVVVEEKLDGANVMLWLEGGRIMVSLRSGLGSADRAGQLGPLRAWAAERADSLRILLESVAVVYAEWLFFTHSVPYDSLPAYLITLDCADEDGIFLAVDQRNEVCSSAGISVPPELFRGVLGSLQSAEDLIGRSAFGAAVAEGVIVRALVAGMPRIAKLLNPRLHYVTDQEWASGRPRNRLKDPAGTRTY